MITKKQAKAFEKEELAASKEYKKLGLTSFAKDEARHSRYFKMIEKKGRR